MSSSESGYTTAAAPGALLAAARQAQNLTVADVARQLKLTVHQVEALESGDYEKLPGPVFVRGFIRNYARLVKVEPEELVRAAVERLPREEPRPAAPPSHDIPFPTAPQRRWPLYAAAVAAVVAALAAYEFYFSDPQPAGTRSVAVPPPASAVEPAAPVAPLAPEAPPAPPAAVPEAAQPQPAPAPPAPGGASDSPPSSPQGRATPQAIPASMSAQGPTPRRGEREVRMVFNQESWVEIRDRSGKAIFSQLNRRGTEKRVNGEPPLSVIVGNAHGVRLTYDDQPVDLAQHTKVDVARFNLE